MNPYKFDVGVVARDPAVQRMLERRTLAMETRRNYVKGIRFFCEHFGQPPSELVEHFKTLSPDEMIDEFSEYFVWAKDRIAPKSAWAWLPGVRALLLENGIREIDRVGRDIAREFRRKFGSPKPLLKRDMVTKEEITQILKIARLRERAIIATMTSGGFRLNAVLTLQLKHLRDDIWDLNLPCYCLEIPETLSKEGEPYLTFISAEAGDYIRNYLTLRQENGENIGPETYLFNAKRKTTPLANKSFENLWRKLCEEAGLDLKPVQIKGLHPVGKKGGGVKLERGSVRYNTRIHSLRKFFKTSCSVNGVDRMASEALLGHSLTKFGVESIYDFSASKTEWLRSEYEKVLRSVTFLKPLPVLPVENHEARNRVKQLEEQLEKERRNKEDLKDRIHRTEEKLVELTKMVEKLIENP